MWLKGCNHSSWSRNPYCHLWIMSCSKCSKALHQEIHSKCTKKLKLLQNADDCQLNRLSHWELPVLAKLQWVAIAFLGECEMFVWFNRALSETCVTQRYLPPTEILQHRSQQRRFHWCTACTGEGAVCSWQGNPHKKVLVQGFFFLLLVLKYICILHFTCWILGSATKVPYFTGLLEQDLSCWNQPV